MLNWIISFTFFAWILLIFLFFSIIFLIFYLFLFLSFWTFTLPSITFILIQILVTLGRILLQIILVRYFNCVESWDKIYDFLFFWIFVLHIIILIFWYLIPDIIPLGYPTFFWPHYRNYAMPSMSCCVFLPFIIISKASIFTTLFFELRLVFY